MTRSHTRIGIIYTANLLLSFHYFLMIYIHSSYVGTFVSPSKLALLYIIGSAINLALFLYIPTILARIGNYKFTLWAIILEAGAVLGMIAGNDAIVVGLAFILHQAVISMILFGLDIFLEGAVKNEQHTGTIRGMYLTLSNLTLVFSPLIVGMLVAENAFRNVYTVSFLFLIPLFMLVRYQLRGASYKEKHPVDIRETIRASIKDRNVAGVLSAHFLLQFFYAWMVIYMPIYLHEHVGFEWKQIGIIFTIMLLPFLLFELPIGNLADKKWGEKEIMSIGFVIMSVATFCVPFLHSTSILLWAGLLFLTRTGASFVEITCESYFFKHVNEHDTGLISLFRLSRPLGYIIAPAAVTVILFIFSVKQAPYGYIFAVLALCVFVGLRYSLSLQDTK